MKVLTDTESLSAVAEAIRAKSGGDEPLVFPEGFVEAVEGIEGGNSYYDTFWDAFQDKGEAVVYTNAFYGSYWTDANFRPKYDIVPTTLSGAFQGAKITDINKCLSDAGVVLDLSTGSVVATGFGNMINGCPTISIPSPINVSNTSNCGSMFRNAYKLQKATIIGIKKTQGWGSCFQGCAELTELYMQGSIGQNIDLSACGKLIGESVQSIIDALADLTEETTQTLSLHANVKAALSEQQLVSITQKNWTVA